MQILNFKLFFEEEEKKQSDFYGSLGPVLGIFSDKDKKNALKGIFPVTIAQKTYDKNQYGIVPVNIEPIGSNKKVGAKIEILGDQSPYVYVKDGKNHNTMKKKYGFIKRTQMDKLATQGFPNSEGQPEAGNTAGGGLPPGAVQ